jgi:hypothetical protein
MSGKGIKYKMALLFTGLQEELFPNDVGGGCR